jgi:hypothetical protein
MKRSICCDNQILSAFFQPVLIVSEPKINSVRTFAVYLSVVALCSFAQAKEKSLDLKSLPAVVRTAIQENLRGGEIKNISKEKEDGVVQYEVETRLNGKSRDFNVDSVGKLLLVEEETSLNAIPAEAQAGIIRKSGSGKITVVETFSKPGQPLVYEAGYTDKAGRRHEVLVKTDGTETRE